MPVTVRKQLQLQMRNPNCWVVSIDFVAVFLCFSSVFLYEMSRTGTMYDGVYIKTHSYLKLFYSAKGKTKNFEKLEFCDEFNLPAYSTRHNSRTPTKIYITFISVFNHFDTERERERNLLLFRFRLLRAKNTHQFSYYFNIGRQRAIRYK